MKIASIDHLVIPVRNIEVSTLISVSLPHNLDKNLSAHS